MNKRLNPAEVSALDKITATQGKEIEVRNTAEKVADLKLKLNEIKDKESLSDEDKLLVKQARELAEKLKEKKWAESLYREQSKELLELLKNFSEEKNQVLDATKIAEQKLDVELQKADQKPLQVVEVPVQPKVNEIYVWNTVYSDLCDINGDGEISKQWDLGLISWYDVYKVLEKNKSNPDLVKNIGYVLGIEFAWVEWLEKALKENPELIN